MAMLNKNTVYRNLLYIKNPKVKKKKSQFSFLYSKPAMFYLILLLSLSLISAGLQKDYTPEGKYGKITLNDCSGIWNGLLCTIGIKNKVTEYTLENVESSIINAYAQGTATIYSDGILFNGVEFNDINNQLVSLNNYQFYILENEDYDIQIPKYKETCKDTFNLTTGNTNTNCINEIIDYKIETRTREIWKPYNYESKSIGTYQWKLEGQRKPNQKIDFILKLTDDIKATEWAWWNSTWSNCKNIEIGNYSENLNNASLTFNFTGIVFANATNELRIVDAPCGSFGNEKKSTVLQNGSNWAYTAFLADVSSTTNATYSVYYNNSNAPMKNYTDPLNLVDDYCELNNNVCGWLNETGEVPETFSYSSPGISLNTGVGTSFLISPINFSAKKDLVVKYKYTVGTAGQFELIFRNDSTTQDYLYNDVRIAFQSNGKLISSQNNINLYSFGFEGTTAEWQIININFNESFNVIKSSRWNDTGYVINNSANKTVSAGNSLRRLSIEWNDLDAVQYVDWIRVYDIESNYISPIAQPVISLGAEQLSTLPSITLNIPADKQTFTTGELTFNCSADGLTGNGIINLTLIIDGVSNNTITNTTAIQNLSLKSVLNVSDSYNHNWTCKSSSLAGEITHTIRTFIVDATLPIINITYPYGNIGYRTMNENLTFNWTVSDLNLSTCWYNYNFTVNVTVPCTQNYSSILLSSKNNITMWANDSLGNIGNFTRSWMSVFENSRTFNSTTYEQLTESFVLNTTSSSITSANLIYNGTSYASTISGTAPNYIISNTLTMNVGNNKSFYWNINSGTNTTLSNQTINAIVFGLCNSTLAVSYLNFTFKNETDSSNMNAAIPTASFDYWLGDGSVKKNYIFINNSENPSYAFCFSPGDRNVNLDYSLQYSATGFPQRVYEKEETLTNVTANRILYLISSSAGIYDTTQVLSSTGQTLSGVDVVVSRLINGVLTTVAQGVTGDDGTVSFFLNPDYLHTYIFTKTGYNQVTQSVFPSSQGHSVTLIASTTTTNSSDYLIGITYTIFPQNILLDNNTVYQFNFTLTSTTWIVSSFGFDLKNASGTILNSTSAATNGGFLSQYLNTGNLSSIKMDFWYVINGSYINQSMVWIIYDDEYDNDWSLKVFFTDLKNYANQGIFGLDQLGLSIIIFIALFVFIGIMSYKFGMVNPGIISIIVAISVTLLQLGFGIINPIAGERFSWLLVIVVWLLAIGMGVREWAR